MSKLRILIVLVCLFSAANAWAVPFKDDFNRADGAPGNGWTILTNGTITVQIVDDEVLIAGTESGTAWQHAGISRTVSGETKISFDFKANDVFNVHVRLTSASSSSVYVDVYAWAGGYFQYAAQTTTWPGWTVIPDSYMVAGQYNNMQIEQNGKDFTVTLNGKVISTINNASFTTIGSVRFTSDADANQKGSIHIDNVQIGKVIPGKAKDPSPAGGTSDVPRDVALSWVAGQYAKTHNVYLGTSLADVNTADISKAVSKGQTETSFQPVSLLEYGKTYYWRVDEVNAAPSTTVFKGDVWSFTAEPYTYTLTGVTATASSVYTGGGNTAAKTTDGSGLTGDQHGTGAADGWLTAQTSKLPGWIRYQFDQPYLIRQMKVWNSNQTIEPAIGFGAKTVLIEYSLDNATWTTLKTEEFPQADGSTTYAGFTVDMNDVYARYIRLTIQANWSLFAPQTGLSEVRFIYVPVQARQPSPANNAAGVPVDSALDWREGRKAASNRVYLSQDKDAVINGTALIDTTTVSFYKPPSLDLGSFYYWRVDEVNNAPASDYSGKVWSFATAQWANIDDFESYTNESPNRVFQTWIDGYGFSPDDNFPKGGDGNKTGAMVGYDPAEGNIMEKAIVHAGQSMPVEYNNVDSPFYSEVERSWGSPQNWMANGATELSLWFRGRPAAFIETASGITLSGSGADIHDATDELRFAYKKLTGDGSITVRVDSVQTAASWTKAGVMIRESLNPLAMSVDIISAAQQGLLEWMYRSSTGSLTTTEFATAANSNPVPVWLKITRVGNVFTGECSTNGTSWTTIKATDGTASSATIAMPSSVYVGMVVCAQSAGNLAVADFSQIQVQSKTAGNVTGQWQAADVGVAQPANGPDQLYLTITDNGGKSKTIVHPNPNATSLGAWTQWRIALKDLAPVNAGAIKKMVIGVGDRSNPKGGAAGMLYIDDIQYGRPIDPTGLVAYYKLEGDTLDSSGNGHDGVLAGDAAYPAAYVDGPTGFGKGMLFEGTIGHQYVALGTFDPSQKTGKLSVALWAKWDGLSTAWQGLIGKRTGAWSASEMMWQVEANQTTGVLRFQREGAGDVILQAAAPTVGQWIHIAVTFDGTTARGYINGVRTVSSGFSFGSNRDAPIQFGADTDGGGNSYNGTLDEVRLYDIVLTDAEIAALAGK